MKKTLFGLMAALALLASSGAGAQTLRSETILKSPDSNLEMKFFLSAEDGRPF